MMRIETLPERDLFGPGPCNVHPDVRAAMAAPTLGHLDPLFAQMMEEVKDMLRQVMGTRNAMTFPLSAPASLAMEASFVNLMEPGDTAIIGINGVFGGRMAEIIERLGGNVVRVESDWGKPVDASATIQAMKDHSDARVVALVHAETSTGVLSDPAPICRAATDAGMLSVVDTVTGLVGCRVDVDTWGADVVYSGTQKCLAVPPGLAPISFSERALHRIRTRKVPVQSWFCDINLVMGYWSGDGARSYHHTAPVNAIYALHKGLRRVLDEGLDTARARHDAAHETLKDGLAEMGLSLFVDEATRLPQLNVVSVPDGVDEAAVRAALLDAHNLEIGAGLGALAGKVWRIGLMGENARSERVELVLGALRAALTQHQATAA